MIIVKHTFVNGLILILMTMTLIACDSSADDELSTYIVDIKQRPAKPIDPIPDFAPLEKFVYPENDARRSPFKQKQVIVEDKLAPNTNRPKQPLEQYPLDSLKFVGILKQTSMVWALVSTPSGEIARVKLGDYMGQNFGKVISITKTQMKLEETIQEEGKWVKKVITFNLDASE